MENFLDYIPHRPPFLFVDRVVEKTEDFIVTEWLLKEDEPFFKGHFPNRPITPGVIMCEFVFQSGAILMAARENNSGDDHTPVITRIQNVKLKNPAFPGYLLKAEVKLKEQTGGAAYMAGKITSDSKKILTVDFAAMLLDNSQANP